MYRLDKNGNFLEISAKKIFGSKNFPSFRKNGIENGILDRKNRFFRSLGFENASDRSCAGNIMPSATEKYRLIMSRKNFVMIKFWWDKTRDNPLVTTT